MPDSGRYKHKHTTRSGGDSATCRACDTGTPHTTTKQIRHMTRLLGDKPARNAVAAFAESSPEHSHVDVGRVILESPFQDCVRFQRLLVAFLSVTQVLHNLSKHTRPAAESSRRQTKRNTSMTCRESSRVCGMQSMALNMKQGIEQTRHKR